MLSIGVEAQEHVPNQRHHAFLIDSFCFCQFATEFQEEVASEALSPISNFTEQDETVWKLLVRDDIRFKVISYFTAGRFKLILVPLIVHEVDRV